MNAKVQAAISELRDVAKRNLFIGYEQYLRANFCTLVGQIVGDCLIIKNNIGHGIAILQDGEDQFRVSDRTDLVTVGGGTPCDSAGLFLELAKLNS